MAKFVTVLFLGALAGAALVFYADKQFALRPPPAAETPAVDRGGAAATAASAEASTSLLAGETSDTAALEASLVRALAQRPSVKRDFEIEALLLRLARIDVRRAVNAALNARLEHRFVAMLYREWADADRAAALESLATHGDTALQHAVAGALLAAAADAALVAELDAVLPSLTAVDLGALALTVRAEHDPSAAFERALAVADPAVMRLAMPEIGAAWARQDAASALAAIERIPDFEVRSDFHGRVLVAWAAGDPSAFLEYLKTFYPTGGVDELNLALGMSEALRALAVDPERLIAIAEQYPEQQRRALTNAALQELMRRDPAAALARIERLPPDEQRQHVTAIAAGYARQDPDGAAAWARGTNLPQATQAVVMTVAGYDLDKAVDLLLADRRAGGTQGMPLTMLGGDRGRIADRLLADGSAEASGVLTGLIEQWALLEPTAALDWALERGPDAVRMVAQRASMMMLRDPDRAARYVARLPPDVAADWNRRLDQQRQLQARGAAAAAVPPNPLAGEIEAAVARDPREAASLVETAPADVRVQTAGTVARAWAAESPREAAAWALRLIDSAASRTAVNGVAAGWAGADFAAADDWVRTLPAGELRDAGTWAIMNAAAASGTFDVQMLARMSSEEARRGAATMLIPLLASRSPDQARALLDRYVTDPTRRAAAERLIETSRRLSAPQ